MHSGEKLKITIQEFKEKSSSLKTRIRYTNEIKREVQEFARVHGITFTSKYLNISKCSVRSWMKEIDLKKESLYKEKKKSHELNFREIVLNPSVPNSHLMKNINSNIVLTSPNGFKLEISHEISEKIMRSVIQSFAKEVL